MTRPPTVTRCGGGEPVSYPRGSISIKSSRCWCSQWLSLRGARKRDEAISLRQCATARERLLRCARNDDENVGIASLFRLVAHRIGPRADPGPLDLDGVAGHEIARRLEAHPGADRRAGRDDVAGLERGPGRNVGDERSER